MTEKIIITQEQARAIEDAKKFSSESRILIDHVKTQWSLREYASLNDLSVDDMARILYEPNSYEIEPQYELENWVLHDGQIVQINTIYENSTAHTPYLNNFRIADELVWRNYDEIERHATPEEIKAEKERQLWKVIDREVGEFRKDDTWIKTSGDAVVVFNPDYAKELYEEGKLKGFYPAESFISFEEGDSDD